MKIANINYRRWAVCILLSFILSNSTNLTAQPIDTIPVVFYLMDDGLYSGTYPITDAIVQDQLALMRLEFASMGVYFCLASEVNDQLLDPMNAVDQNHTFLGYGVNNVTSTTTGIYRIEMIMPGTGNFDPDAPGGVKWQGLSNFSPLSGKNYLRIFVHNLQGGGASWPGRIAAGNRHDLVWVSMTQFGVKPNCGHCITGNDLGITTLHEVGHFLSLRHTHHGTTTTSCVGYDVPGSGNGDDCDKVGDYCCDTPPQQNVSSCVDNTNFCNQGPVNMDNYMSYSAEMCQNKFTIDQGIRVQKTLNNLVIDPVDSAGGSICLASLCNRRATGCSNNAVEYAGEFCAGELITLFDKDCYDPMGNYVVQSSLAIDSNATPKVYNTVTINTDGEILPANSLYGEYSVLIPECGTTISFKIIDCCPFSMTLHHSFPTYGVLEFTANTTPVVNPPPSNAGYGFIYDWQLLNGTWAPPTGNGVTHPMTSTGPPYNMIVHMQLTMDLYNSATGTVLCSETADKLINLDPGPGGPPLREGAPEEKVLLNELGISIFPNPSTGLFTISMDNDSGHEITFDVYSFEGKTIKENMSMGNGKEIQYELNLEEQEHGMYFIQINAGETSQIQRLMLE